MKSPGTASRTPSAWSPDPEVVRLAGLIARYTPHDGLFELRIPGVYAIRVSRTSSELLHALQRPALFMVTQGAKTILLGQEVYQYDAARMLIYFADLPVAGQVTRATTADPYLSFKLDLDPSKIAALVPKVFPHGVPRMSESRGMAVSPINVGIVNAAARLLEVMAHPGDAELLAPLIVEEILIRLLRSPVGVRVAQIGLAESSSHGIAKALAWLRSNFSQPMKIEELADRAHMSVRSFHQHFKAITSMSPLQYQKVLRLQEARRLMLATMVDAGTASWRVGYQSPSQFSREYGRFFGNAPTKDIAHLRAHSALDPGLEVAQVAG